MKTATEEKKIQTLKEDIAEAARLIYFLQNIPFKLIWLKPKDLQLQDIVDMSAGMADEMRAVKYWRVYGKQKISKGYRIMLEAIIDFKNPNSFKREGHYVAPRYNTFTSIQDGYANNRVVLFDEKYISDDLSGYYIRVN